MLKGISSTSDKFLADLGRIQDRSSKVQNQISSGLRVQRPSDAPESITDIFRLRSLIERNTQTQTNLGRVTSETDTAEAAVRQAVQLLERASTLAAQTSGNSGEVERPIIGIEAKQLHDQLVNLVRTTSEGRFVFSGDLDQQLLYRVDATLPGGVEQLATATNTRLVEDETGSRFSAGKSAHELFEAPGDANAFEAVFELVRALETDNRAGVQAAQPKLEAALNHLNKNLTFYGQVQNRVAAAITAAKNQKIALSKELRDIQDTDMTEALVELNLVKIQQDTALAAHAQLPKTSLFDYLA